MAFGGAALKVFTTFLYALCFCCAAIILGFYSYFLAVQADHNGSRTIPKWEKAVEGISGAGVLYTIFAVVLTCCLGGKRIFAFTAILLDVLFFGAFLAIAIMTRDGARSCTGNDVRSPLGRGPANQKSGFGDFGFNSNENVTYAVSNGLACRYNKTCFAVSIIGAFLFLLSAILQIWLGRHHQREKKFGPSPTNNYTSGSGKKWFQRRRGAKTTHAAYAKDAEATGGLATTGTAPDTYRPSHETGTTAPVGDATYTGNKYEATQPHIPTTGGYHTGPSGTGVNPYGYENGRTAGANF